MLLSERLRALGLTSEAMAQWSVRDAALCDELPALAVRVFRDGDDSIRSPFRLHCIRDMYFFADWDASNPHAVLPPGETAAILLHAAQPFARAARVLDLGCGSGVLALLLSRSADLVIATDLNPRAVALARLNARTNGIRNVRFRRGSLFEPVRSERFDLIVSQPPYLPQPANAPRHLFLHGGQRGDELAHAIIAAAVHHLAPNGRAFVFSDWPLHDDEQLTDRLPPVPAKLTLFASPAITPESYAAHYGPQSGITGIRQCLTVIEHGSGVTQHEVLPHEWLTIASRSTPPPPLK